MGINLRKELKATPIDANLINRLTIVELGLHKDYEAFWFFKKAVKVKPGVQSLNNLAWFYLDVILSVGCGDGRDVKDYKAVALQGGNSWAEPLMNTHISASVNSRSSNGTRTLLSVAV